MVKTTKSLLLDSAYCIDVHQNKVEYLLFKLNPVALILDNDIVQYAAYHFPHTSVLLVVAQGAEKPFCHIHANDTVQLAANEKARKILSSACSKGMIQRKLKHLRKAFVALCCSSLDPSIQAKALTDNSFVTDIF